jgi:CubicO group peptidase (beta-lactamase class C family)
VGQAAHTATGFASQVLCDDVFISGLQPDKAFQERVLTMPGMRPVAWALRHEVDKDKQEVTVSLAGRAASRARFRDGLGCLAAPLEEADGVWASQPAMPSAPSPMAAEAQTVPLPVQADEGLQAVLAKALVDEPGGPVHRTKAIVVLHDGKLVGERYADGIGVDTPMLGFSATKSVVNALIGVMVRQGRLKLDAPAPLAGWADPANPRHAITVDQLLRQTSGLDLPQDNTGFDISSHIMFTVRDKAAAAMAGPMNAQPGAHWAYSDMNYMLLSRILRDAAGGSAKDVLNFAQAELFGPVGMQHVTLDVDATGTPLGSAHMLAPARAWARFGQLFLDDGMVGTRRILPQGWVRQSMAPTTTPALQTGYGAGWWTNQVDGKVPQWGAPWGLSKAPRDAFFARGYMGQYVVVIPSRRLVIVRLSVSQHQGDDVQGTNDLVGEVLARLQPAPVSAQR